MRNTVRQADMYSRANMASSNILETWSLLSHVMNKGKIILKKNNHLNAWPVRGIEFKMVFSLIFSISNFLLMLFNAPVKSELYISAKVKKKQKHNEKVYKEN